MTPEGKVKTKVKRVLDAAGAYYFMPVQLGYGTKTIDFLCCVRGAFVGVETKAKGKAPTPLQQDTMRSIEAAGGVTFVIDGDEGIEELKFWIKVHLMIATRSNLTQGEENDI